MDPEAEEEEDDNVIEYNTVSFSQQDLPQTPILAGDLGGYVLPSIATLTSEQI